jgi:reactive intermediate/imine deaminase
MQYRTAFTLTSAFACIVTAACATNKTSTRLTPEFLANAAGSAQPFSAAVRLGDVIYVSGQIGTDGSGKLAAGGVRAETRQALSNIRDVLVKNGSSMDRVVKCTVFMADMADWAAMNEVYVTFFPEHRPARSSFGTTGLAYNARLEIECMAAA